MKLFNKEEYNKLCAEFLGWTFSIHGVYKDELTRYKKEELKFDSDWNWIIEVCAKINSVLIKSNIKMRNQCKCKLPYVHNGTDTCTQCGNQQSRFLPIITDKPISVKREFNGTEFKPKDIVEVIGKSYACLAEIIHYIPNGWYRVKFPNGCFHETQILGDVVY